MNIYGLLLAPPVMLGIVTIIDKHAVGLFFTTGMGLGIFAIAMVFILSGVFWARRIARIDV
jgi:Flp pilus assembly protein TadB